MLTVSFLRKMTGTMSGWDFDREFLGQGDYIEEDGWSVVDKDTWDDLIKVDPPQTKKFAVGIAARHDRSESSVAIAVRRKDGGIHVEVVKKDLGTYWIVDFVKRWRKRRPCTFVINPRAAENIIIPELEALKPKIKLYKPNANEYAQFCAKFLSMITETQDLSHNGQEVFDNCLANARFRMLGQGLWTWEHEDVPGDVSGVDAATAALGGLIVKGSTVSGPKVASVNRGEQRNVRTGDDGDTE